MVFQLGWFSTGRDEAARGLLEVVMDHISEGTIPAEIAYAFCNRGKGEALESDRFIQFVEALGIRPLLFSSKAFLPSLRERDRETWRVRYHQEVKKRIRDYPTDAIVLAGYMLIVSQPLCEAFSIINLHPAEPGGPKGTWQEVIWELIRRRAFRTGVMIHLVTKDLDEGPPITFATFPIQGPGFDPLWRDFDLKLRHRTFAQISQEEGESNLLFKEIRDQGIRRELPLIVMTLKALAEGRVRIDKGKVLDERGKEIAGICLNQEVEEGLLKQAPDSKHQ